ncbi:unnamed protein product [Closterium sp. NIES-64]|nr:unnamed protein product [Closterium sp. NIES-64]
MSSLAEYLKRYTSDGPAGGEEKKKKKKKKKGAAPAKNAGGLVLVDADATWQKPIGEEADEEEDEPVTDAPQVEEDVEVRRQRRLEEARKRELEVREDGSGWVTVDRTQARGGGRGDGEGEAGGVGGSVGAAGGEGMTARTSLPLAEPDTTPRTCRLLGTEPEKTLWTCHPGPLSPSTPSQTRLTGPVSATKGSGKQAGTQGGGSMWKGGGGKAERMMDGSLAGLRSGKEVMAEAEEKRAKDEAR